MFVGEPRLVAAPEGTEQVRAGGVEQVVRVERTGQRIEFGERGLRSGYVSVGDRTLGVPFLAVNCVLGDGLVALAWWRLRPGIGTVVQSVVVGGT